MSPNSPLYRAVLFDMDGVLVDSMSCHKSAFNEVLSPFGLSVNIEDIAGRSTREIIKGLLAERADLNEQREICRIKTERALEHFRRMGIGLLLPDAPEMVQRISAILPVALCTSASYETASYVSSVLMSNCDFSAVVTSADVSSAKPHPETYELALQKLGISPSHGLVVEDSQSGVMAGHAAGCDVAHLTQSCADGDQCPARYHIRSLQELPPLIQFERSLQSQRLMSGE